MCILSFSHPFQACIRFHIVVRKQHHQSTKRNNVVNFPIRIFFSSSSYIQNLDEKKIKTGNSVAGHSHFQSAAVVEAVAASTLTAAHTIMNGTAGDTTTIMNTIPATAEDACEINSVLSADAIRSSAVALENEVGSTQAIPQPSLRKSLEVVAIVGTTTTASSSTVNQFHSRHGSEHNTQQEPNSSPSSDLSSTTTVSNSLVSDRKQKLEQKTSAVIQKYLKSQQKEDEKEKRSSLPDWFPSKRNSLILLADQNLDQLQEKRNTNRQKMVAMQEQLPQTAAATPTAFDVDTSEELQYGPGIVSKLRCRYLSLALRQTVKQRPTLDNMRRANSMSNLLEEDIDEVDDRNAHGGHHNNSANATMTTAQSNISSISDSKMNLNGSSSVYRGSGDRNVHNHQHLHQYNDKLSANQNGSNGKIENGETDDIMMADAGKMRNGDRHGRCPRALQRGNDMKRARSVEALMRYDTLAWRRDVLEDSDDYPSSNPIILDEIIVSDYQSTVIKAKTADSITIEDKIQQARDRMSDPKPPRRLTSFMPDTERPPPDLVKQTLLKFEATANRRARTSIQRYGHGDVAAKVATYKSKLSQDKIVIPVSLPPTISSKKPVIKPRTTSPKAAAAPFFNGMKMEQSPPAIPSTQPPSLVKKTVTIQQCNGNGLKSSNDAVERMNQKNSAATTNAMRIDTANYRNNKYISPETPTISPINGDGDSPRSSYVFDMVRRRETNHLDSPLITQLARKTENIHLTTPKSRKILSDVVAYNSNSTDDSSAQASSDNDDGCADDDDDGTSNSSEMGWCESYDVNTSDTEINSVIGGGGVGGIDEQQFLAKKPPVPRTTKQLNGNSVNQIKATVINVTPIQTNGKSAKSIDHHLPHQPEPSVRQIGIIRPLNHEAPAKQPPIPIARKSQPISTNHMTTPPPPLPTSSSSSSSSKTDSIKVNVAAAPIVVSTQHSVVLPSSTSSVVVTNSVSVATSNDCQGDVVVIECGSNNQFECTTSDVSTAKSMSSPPIPTTPPPSSPSSANNRTKLMTNTESNTISIDTRSIVHQKNLLNKEKSEEMINQRNHSPINIATSPMNLSPIKWKSTIVSSSPLAPAAATATAAASPTTTTLVVNTQNTATASSPTGTAAAGTGKQRPNDIHTTNTMVFNFSNRKDVPDYIENDGLVIRRKRELPKVSLLDEVFFCD